MSRAGAIVLADCQGPAISWVLGQLPALRDAYDFQYYENWDKTGALGGVPDETLEACRLLFFQVGDCRLTEEVRAQLSPDCRIVTFGSPALHAVYPRRGRWPWDAEGKPRCTLHPELAEKLAIALFKTGLGKEQYLAEYPTWPIDRDADIDQVVEEDRARLERIDQDLDVPVADFILSNFRTRKLFHCVDHPTNELYMFQMKAMIAHCARLGLRGFEAPAALADGLYAVERSCPAAFGATEFFGDVQVPVHPGVIDALGLTWCTPDTVYDNRGVGAWTHAAYIDAIYDHMME